MELQLRGKVALVTVKGHLSTNATMLFVREELGFRLASFHNTERESTQPRHNSVMLEAISSAAIRTPITAQSKDSPRSCYAIA